MKTRVSDYIFSAIAKAGTRHVFVVSGGGAMYLNDALALNQSLKYINNFHEQASVMAADTYSRVNGNLGVALVTSGPGGSNAVTAVLGAWQDSIPLLVISGQSKRKETVYNSNIKGLRQFGFLEVNIIPIVETITKYSVFVDEPEKIRYYLEKAVYMAKSGRPGPVWLDIPLDVQGAEIEISKLTGFTTPNNAPNRTSVKNQVAQVVKILLQSKKPVIIAGSGIRHAGAIDDFLKLLSGLKVPVVTSIMGVDVIADNHPSFVGRVGARGERSANFAVNNSDLVISIGARLGVAVIGYEYEKFAPLARKIIVDIDEVEHKKPTIKPDLVVNLDAKIFINELDRALRSKRLEFKVDWLSKLSALRRKYPVYQNSYRELKCRMNVYHVILKITNSLKADDVVVTDAGTPYYVARQIMKIKKGQRLLMPGATGVMGFNLPGVIGASVGRGNIRAICITGDGSLQFNISELQTISHYKIPVKLFVLNNNGYMSIRNTQSRFFNGRLMGESPSTNVTFPKVSNVANTYKIKYLKAENNRQLNSVILKTLKFNGPVICELMCLPNQEVIPSVSSKRLDDGTLVSTAIDEMYPFLPEEEVAKIRKDLS